MFKCGNCGEEYEAREDFVLETGTDNEDFRVFDGKRMRDTCPKCGGLIYEQQSVYRRAKKKAA